jgi:hypothetical protein
LITTVSELSPPAGFQFLHPAPKSRPGLFSTIPSGRPIDPQIDIPVSLVRAEGREKLAPSDYPFLTSRIPIFSEKAFSLLQAFLTGYGQFFSLSSSDGSFYGFNVTNIVDALDMSSSDIDYFPGTSRILEIRRHVFRDDLELPPVFIIPQFTRASKLFVTSEYVDAVAATGLPGACFTELWTRR